MNKLVHITSITSIIFLLSACASTQSISPVIARADATFETTGIGKTKLIAQENALDAAKKQCGIRTPVIVKDSTTYNGVMDERTGRIIEQGISVMGAIFGTASPKLSRDDDYEYNISFKCQ